MPANHSVDPTKRAVAMTQMILGKAYYDGLTNFFSRILTTSSPNGATGAATVYIAFITRRCSCLFYLYLLNNRRCYDKERTSLSFDIPSFFEIMTESALVDAGRRIGEEISEVSSVSDLPSLILVDDSISYGRALNSVLNAFLHGARQSIQEKTKSNKMPAAMERLSLFLRQNVKIRIFAEKAQTKLLKGNYQDLLESEVVLPSDQWNDFSTRLSELVHCSDIANAAFVMSVGTKKQELPLEPWKNLDWSYRGFSENVFYRPVLGRDGYSLVAFATIRRIRSTSNHFYRLVPFLLLPQMAESVFESLEEAVFNQLYAANVIPEGYQTMRPRLSRYVSTATRTSFVTTYLSHSMLVEAIPSVLDHPPMDWDEIKINWTYYELIKERIIPGTLLSDLQKKNNRVALLSFKKIEELLSSLKIETPITARYRELSDVPEEEKQQAWNQVFEEFLFKLAIKSEAFAHQTVTARFRPGDSTLLSSHLQRYRFLRAFLQELESFLLESHPDKVGTLSTPELFAVMLQMMDASAMAVVSDETEGDKETSHQIRICEQALAAIPRRFYAHTDLIQFIQSNRWMRDGQIEQLIQFYLEKLSSNGQMLEPEQEKLSRGLREYLRKLDESSLKTSYWTLGINRHFTIDPETQELIKDLNDARQREKRKQYNALFRDMMKMG